jgi:hypothetical protein
VRCPQRYRNKPDRRMVDFGRIQVTQGLGSRKSKARGTFIRRELRETTVHSAPSKVMPWFGSGWVRTMSTRG